MRKRKDQAAWGTLLFAVLALTGCGGEDEPQSPGAVSTTAPAAPPSSAPIPDSAASPAETATETDGANSAPTLAGAPKKSVSVGSAYAFQPAAGDANGDTLMFSIANKPVWVTFNTATGKLSGTPQAAHVGTHQRIRITVSDGHHSVSLPEFAIDVTQIATGVATLSWMPPLENNDGSALTDLAAYRLLYGTSANSLDRSVEIANPGITRYMVENLSPGTWYFALKSVNTAGTESALSPVVSKEVG
jgi:hypothetical protein